MRIARRGFLSVATGALAGAAQAPLRSTAGDASEPDWTARLTLTVGPSKADIVGSNEKALQAAVDAVGRQGGGTVRILPGIYKLRNAVYLQSKVRILGSGADSVLIKEPSFTAALAEDSDWYDQEITVTDARGLTIGDGVCLRAKNPSTGGPVTIKRTLVAQSGNRFKLDRALRDNLWLEGKPTVSTLFPLFSGENLNDIVIENIALDGNGKNNDKLDGNFAGCVFLQDCNKVALRRVEARNYHGDGLSWQICHDVTVEECYTHDHTGLGFHPGSGAQRTVLRRNRSQRNEVGIFFCWGVRFGFAIENTLEENRFGITIGHRDNDNVVRGNTIRGSKEAGIVFRPEPDVAKSATRNRVEANEIIDSGNETGVAIDVQGFTTGNELKSNRLRETRGPARRVGIRLGAKTGETKLTANQIEGFAMPTEDMRSR
jgi:hypothetical protein